MDGCGCEGGTSRWKVAVEGFGGFDAWKGGCLDMDGRLWLCGRIVVLVVLEGGCGGHFVVLVRFEVVCGSEFGSRMRVEHVEMVRV